MTKISEFWFSIGDSNWCVEEVSESYLKSLYKESEGGDCNYAFGFCLYPWRRIYICEEMCLEEKLRTFKHEMMHALLWTSGIQDFNEFSGEDICNFAAAFSSTLESCAKDFEAWLGSGKNDTRSGNR